MVSYEDHHVDSADLRESSTLLNSIIDGVADSIMVIGTDYRIRLMNRSARESARRAIDHTEPLFCYEISHQRDAPCGSEEHPCPLLRVRELGRPVKVVHKHHVADGEERLFEVLASPLWTADGTFDGIIEAIRDVTERVLAEETLREYTKRLHALTAQLADVAEEERQQLARELHDQVGQSLTALGINLSMVRSQLAGEGPHVCARLDDSLSLVEQTSERIRDVMANLRPPVLDDYGLVAALRWYAEQYVQRTGITVEVRGAEPSPRLAQRVENGLFRIVQEALTNVAKHAHASHVIVKLDADSQSLTVSDNGVGFDPAQVVGQGWGLLTMRERIGSLGGHFHLESSPGQGTRLTCELAP